MCLLKELLVLCLIFFSIITKTAVIWLLFASYGHPHAIRWTTLRRESPSCAWSGHTGLDCTGVREWAWSGRTSCAHAPVTLDRTVRHIRERVWRGRVSCGHNPPIMYSSTWSGSPSSAHALSHLTGLYVSTWVSLEGENFLCACPGHTWQDCTRIREWVWRWRVSCAHDPATLY